MSKSAEKIGAFGSVAGRGMAAASATITAGLSAAARTAGTVGVAIAGGVLKGYGALRMLAGGIQTLFSGGVGQVFGNLSAAITQAGVAMMKSGDSTTAAVGALLAVVGTVASVATAAVRAAIGWFEDGVAKVKELAVAGKQAAVLGVLADDFMAMANNAKRFGVEGEDFVKVMTKLAAMRVPPAIGALGANKQALDPDKWIKLDAVGRATMLADAISRLPSANDRASASMAVFEKHGAKMLPLMAQGAAGIEAFAARQRMLGLAVSQDGMDKVLEAASAWARLRGVFEGMGNKMAVAFAPFMTVISDNVERLIPAVMPIIDTLVQGATRFFDVLGFLSGKVGDEIHAGVNIVAEYLGGWEAITGAMPGVQEAVTGAMRAIAVAGAYAFDALKAGLGGVLVAGGALTNTVGQLADKLGLSWGKTLAASGSATMKLGAGMAGAFGQSVEIVEGWFDEMDRRAVKSAIRVKAVASAMLSEYHPAGAFQEGTQQAFSVEARWKTESMSRDAPAVAEAKKTNEELKKHTNLLEDIRRKFGGDPVRLEVI